MGHRSRHSGLSGMHLYVLLLGLAITSCAVFANGESWTETLHGIESSVADMARTVGDPRNWDVADPGKSNGKGNARRAGHAPNMRDTPRCTVYTPCSYIQASDTLALVLSAHVYVDALLWYRKQ